MNWVKEFKILRTRFQNEQIGEKEFLTEVEDLLVRLDNENNGRKVEE